MRKNIDEYIELVDYCIDTFFSEYKENYNIIDDLFDECILQVLIYVKNKDVHNKNELIPFIMNTIIKYLLNNTRTVPEILKKNVNRKTNYKVETERNMPISIISFEDDTYEEKYIDSIINNLESHLDFINCINNTFIDVEVKIITYLLKGYNKKEICKKLNISMNELEKSLSHIRLHSVLEFLI